LTSFYPAICLLHIQLALDAEFLDAFAQCRTRNAEQFRGVNLVVARFLERLDDDQFALDSGNNEEGKLKP
jgi:hypothetical protein